MRKSLRLVLVILFVLAVLAGAIQAKVEHTRVRAELNARVEILALGLEEAVANLLERGQSKRLARLLKQFRGQEQGAWPVVCSQGRAIIGGENGTLHRDAVCGDASVLATETSGAVQTRDYELGQNQYFGNVRRIEAERPIDPPHSLVLLHSLEGISASVRGVFFRSFLAALIAGLAGLLLYELLSRWVLRQSLQMLVRWTRSIFRGETAVHSSKVRELGQRLPEEFRELTRELSSLALKMRQERLRLVWNSQAAARAAVPGAPPAGALDDRWTSLRTKVNDVLKGRQLVIVANREPYSHERDADGKVHVVRPASGVVTALEPIMRLCGGGIWVGHASGSADRETVDKNDEVAVPPEHPTYKLRRVWLTREEENGYYYGFSNEGLWPLCHLAYTRPVFRLSDWEMYQRVNRKFAEATLRGADPANTVILVQDYHYALLPRMLRDAAPGIAVELFWHIPWPNPEAFGICPQYHELLEGMLGADVVGFHTQFHCNNFLETCDRYLECRVDWERFSVTVGNHETLVRSYPISIATEPVPRITDQKKAELRERYGIRAPMVGLGVDRLDYTKGLLERLAGVERFLEKYPEFIGQFSYVEMGTPSRTNIPSYRHLIEEFEGSVERINKRFGRENYKPIVLLKGHYDWGEVAEFYQLGQVCLVTSLHDGMNLVAKEYVWSQSADKGALILSRFTGAARELSEALIVNPYSTEEIADAIYLALTMPEEERTQRMRRMKEKVQGHNAFHWATDLLDGVNAKA